jgi:hypothetical protein
VEAMNNPKSPEKISTDAVEAFVKENVVSADSSRVECGDGRYTAEQSQGAIRAFGADFGMVLAFASAVRGNGVEFSNDNLVSSYLNAIKAERGEDAKLYLQTDDHNEKSGGIGCGHVYQASKPENEGKYGNLKSNEVKELYESMLLNPSAKLTVLNGEHLEKAVLLVYAGDADAEPKFSVNSSDGMGNMFFIADMDGIKRYMEKFVPRMANELGIEVTPEQVWQSYEEQQNATAGILAGGLDTYRVEIDDLGSATTEKLQ